MHVTVRRAGTEHLMQALRERQVDALMIDARSLSPSPELRVTIFITVVIATSTGRTRRLWR